MVLPSNFDDFENFQSTLMRVHNRLVREEFSDVGGEDWLPDISTPRGALRTASTIRDNDSDTIVLSKLIFYYLVLRKAQDLQAPIYSIPLEDAQATRKFRPQIVLWFKEDESDVEDDYQPVKGRISYRLMNESSTTITKTELTAKANRIKTEFGTGDGYVWRKGKDMASYKDPENGYEFQLLVRSKTDAKELIGKVLDTNQDTPDWKYLQYKEADSPTGAFPTLPPSHVVLGETQRQPRRRPIASVRFQYAYCDIWGKGKPVILYDKSFCYLNALVSDSLL